MKSFIIGRGLLGNTLAEITNNHTFHYGRTPFDLDNLDIDYCERHIFYHKPDVVYFCAANANVEDCETNPQSYVTNVAGTIALLNVFIHAGTTVVFPSSSYVFNGMTPFPYSEDSVTNPINAYGLQKTVVEGFLRQHPGNSIIVRTVGVFGELDNKERNFAYQIMNPERPLCPLPSDQSMNPIHAEDLARSMVFLAQEERVGEIVNVGGDRVVSKYHFAQLISDAAYRRGIVLPGFYPMESDQLKQKANRPRMGALDTRKMKNFGIEVPSLEEGIERFLDGVLRDE